jgi:hypothetical protein
MLEQTNYYSDNQESRLGRSGKNFLIKENKIH